MNYHLIRNASETLTGPTYTIGAVEQVDTRTFQAVVTGTGAVTATIVVEVSNDSTLLGWLTLGTITLSGTTTATDGFASDAPWQEVRGRVTAITGTGANAALVMGV